MDLEYNSNQTIYLSKNKTKKLVFVLKVYFIFNILSFKEYACG